MKLTKTLFTTALLSVSLFSFHSAAWANTVEQQYQEGLTAAENGNYKAALEILLPLAQKGDRQSMKVVGMLYAFGVSGHELIDKIRDEYAAEKWLGAACREKDQEACEKYKELFKSLPVGVYEN